MKKKTIVFVIPKGYGPQNVNQHAPVFLHRATKRARAKDVQKKNAIRDSLLAATMI
jgi:hypothetical protein